MVLQPIKSKIRICDDGTGRVAVIVDDELDVLVVVAVGGRDKGIPCWMNTAISAQIT